MENQVILVGAGIVGNYIAILLHNLGYDVTVYERGLSPTETNQQGKSINLAYSMRGQVSIEKAGITITDTVPMHGRLLHGETSTKFLVYSQFGEALLSINRNGFNAKLFQHAEKLGIKYYFQHNVDNIDKNKKILSITNNGITQQIPYELLLGTDGSNTKVGNHLESGSSSDKIEPAWQYIELEIKPDHDNKFKLPDAENFHIWPKSQHVFLIGLPNSDGSFTLTLFVHSDANIDLRSIQNKNDYAKFYDIIDSVVKNKSELEQIDIETSFRNNKVSFIYTRASTIFMDNDKLPSIGLIGDALVAPPPFLGLACNAHMEAAYHFTETINKYNHLSKIDAFRTALVEFYQVYMPNMIALLDASIDNAKVLSHSDPDYELKYQLTQYLEKREVGLFVEEHSLYSFTTIPLFQARNRQLWQSKILSELVEFPGIREKYAGLCGEYDSTIAFGQLILDEQFILENDRQLQWYQKQMNM